MSYDAQPQKIRAKAPYAKAAIQQKVINPARTRRTMLAVFCSLDGKRQTLHRTFIGTKAKSAARDVSIQLQIS